MPVQRVPTHWVLWVLGGPGKVFQKLWGQVREVAWALWSLVLAWPPEALATLAELPEAGETPQAWPLQQALQRQSMSPQRLRCPPTSKFRHISGMQ